MIYNKNFNMCNEIEKILTENEHKLEILKGYCENIEPEAVSSCLLTTILKDIYDNHKLLMRKIDIYCTTIGHFILKNQKDLEDTPNNALIN